MTPLEKKAILISKVRAITRKFEREETRRTNAPVSAKHAKIVEYLRKNFPTNKQMIDFASVLTDYDFSAQFFTNEYPILPFGLAFIPTAANPNQHIYPAGVSIIIYPETNVGIMPNGLVGNGMSKVKTAFRLPTDEELESITEAQVRAFENYLTFVE